MKKILITVASILLLGGCYPGGAEYVEDADIVYTTFDEEYDFQSSSTFALPDKIVVDVEIDRGDTTYVYMLPVFATPILASIKNNMESRGWSEVDISEADVVLTPAGIKSTTYFYSYWYDWWYGGYWGWYYPPYYTVSSYTTGTMIITMSDPSMASESPINQSPTVWISAANGVFTGNYNIDRVTESIDQSFEQSPYLQLN